MMYQTYNKIISISNGTTYNLLKWQPSIRTQTTLLYNGIPDYTAVIPKATNTYFNFLIIGRMDDSKGHKFIFKILGQIKSQNWHLKLLGRGPLENELKQLAIDLGIAKRVSFCGFQQNISSYLSQTDLYLQPSKWEGFGIACLEAMAHSIPVIASDLPGLKEVVGKAGELLPYGDETIWVNKLNQILDNPKQLEPFKKLSHKQSQKFLLEKHIDGLLTIYNSAANPKSE